MYKYKITTMTVLTFIIFLFGSNIYSKANKVNNDEKNNTFPAKMLGKWYSYNKNVGVTKLVISKNKMVMTNDKLESAYLLSNKKNDDLNTNNLTNFSSNIYINSSFKTKKDGKTYKWLKIMDVGKNNKLYTSFNFSINKKMPILTCALGSKNIILRQFYKKESTAKKYYNIKYKGFNYTNS